ncbi:TolC family protein [Woeseia oceani]|uniref:Transporter n=1 Tax=Woeseia oceani TaxID=1548547 RepID=A0A193LC85_9GAMM|nr:TolC family protein [Woeseia oceani]ANO50009.1 hypothetical protein BA177_01130 [Woeseia oceani]
MSARTLYVALVCAAFAVAAPPLLAGTQSNPGPQERAAITADELVRRVLDNNPGLAAAGAAAEAAFYRVEPAGSLDDPMLGYGVAPLTASADRSLNQRIEFSQRIPWPGTLAAREAEARHDARAMDADQDALVLDLAANARMAHAEWRYINEALRIHHETRAILDDLVAVAESRYAAGRATKQDVIQAELERERLNRHELLLRREQTTIQARINALLNRSPAAALPAAAPIDVSEKFAPVAELEAMAIAAHPELRRLAATVDARESRVTLAKKAFLPDFQVGVGYNSLWDPVDKRPIIGVSINVPLYRGKRQAELDRARADVRRASFALDDRQAALLSELAAARSRVVEARDAVDLYESKLLPLADEFLSSAVADYRSGDGAFLNVITAEQRKLDTELAYVRAVSDHARHVAELRRWSGASIDLSRESPVGVSK